MACEVHLDKAAIKILFKIATKPIKYLGIGSIK